MYRIELKDTNKYVMLEGSISSKEWKSKVIASEKRYKTFMEETANKSKTMR